jgi:hypothetical protein
VKEAFEKSKAFFCCLNELVVQAELILTCHCFFMQMFVCSTIPPLVTQVAHRSCTSNRTPGRKFYLSDWPQRSGVLNWFEAPLRDLGILVLCFPCPVLFLFCLGKIFFYYFQLRHPVLLQLVDWFKEFCRMLWKASFKSHLPGNLKLMSLLSTSCILPSKHNTYVKST